MKRRDLLLAATAVATGAGVSATLKRESKSSSASNTSSASSLASPNINRGIKEFRMVTSWPKDFPGLGQMANRFAQNINDISGGQLNVKVFAAGELVGALECFDAVSTGAADIYHSAEYYWTGKSKAFAFFTTMPMGMTASEIMAWVNHGGGQELWDELSAQFNVKAFQAGNTGHQTGGWFKREMNGLEDFRGLKIRMPGLGGDVIRRLGGAAVRLAGGEIYQALQSGNIDATEWVGPWNDIALGFYREAPHYYAPGFHEPGASLAVGINLDLWNSLNKTEQAIFSTAAQHANNMSLGEYTHQNGVALKTLKDVHGITPKFFSDEIMSEIGRISEDVVADVGTENALAQKIYQSYKTSRDNSAKWTEMSDGRFIRAREKALGALSSGQ